MIDLYTWGTPNGRKVSVMLEECGLAYNVHPIDIGKGDQFAPEFVAIDPNSKIPAIVDSEGPDGKPFSLFESGAILIYLSGKTGKFLPDSARGDIDFDSFSGEFQSDLPVTLATSSRRNFRGSLNGGGNTDLKLKTFSGSVSIRR